jgi:hypothetical protein
MFMNGIQPYLNMWLNVLEFEISFRERFPVILKSDVKKTYNYHVCKFDLYQAL